LAGGCSRNVTQDTLPHVATGPGTGFPVNAPLQSRDSSTTITSGD